MSHHPKALAISIAIAMSIAASPIPARPQPQSGGSEKNVLHVHLDGFRSNNGKAHCTLYDNPDAFPSDDSKALKEGEAALIANADATVDFTGIAAGKYAVVCYHDENSNGKFDENMLGMPKEGYCFSNNVRPRFSAPKFPECSFDYTGGDQSIEMRMIY